LNIDRYFHIVDSLLYRHWAVVDDDSVYTAFSDVEGKITSRVYFLDGSYLDFEEYIEIRLDRIIKHRYKYQYIKEGKEVFRYDNFPLHPRVPFPYHHKHVRDVERVEILADAPRLLQVISEVVDMLFV